MASPDTRPAQRNGAVPAFSRVQELTKFNGRSFCNTRTGLFSTARPATGAGASRPMGMRLHCRPNVFQLRCQHSTLPCCSLRTISSDACSPWTALCTCIDECTGNTLKATHQGRLYTMDNILSCSCSRWTTATPRGSRFPNWQANIQSSSIRSRYRA